MEMALKEMNARGMAKGAFTRARNTLFNHIYNGVEDSTTLASKSQMEEQLSELEEACLKYLEASMRIRKKPIILINLTKIGNILVKFMETF